MKGPLFDGLTPAQVTKLAAWLEPASFAAGETIFNERERAERLYVVEGGEVAIRYRPEDGGGYLTIATVRPGGVCGWSAALGRARYTSAAVCLTDVQALAMRG
ncbi:MAG: cyclic nucleotide-binding domain-containing protein, partial [Chloroflexota bacterium]